MRPNVRFHDGAVFDAEAMRANLERYRTAPENLRKSELSAISAVEVVEPLVLRIRLSRR